MVDTSLKLGNDVFTVSPLGGEASFLLQPKLLPLVVDFVMAAGALNETVGEGFDAAAIAAKVGPIVQSMVGKLSPDDLKYIMRTLLTGATMNGTLLYQGAAGEPIHVLLQRRTLDTWRLLIHAVRVSYPDFFDLARALRDRPAAGGSSATSNTSSPGPSTGS
jgi:hypothetical protein